jgi:hypothetical protein
MLRQCLLNQGMMQVGGDEYDARVPYRNAMGPVMQKLLSHWKNKMLGGLNVDIVLVSGGGGGLSYTTFVEKLGHNHIYLADDIATINLANLRGSVVAAQQWCIANRGKLPDRGGQMPVLVSIDPGNADIKVTLVGDV